MSNNLLKVMLVDDERLVRDLLKVCIDWEEIGMTIIGESASAIEGIELVDRFLPDIIFADICMPVMDGLEFSKKVMEKHPNIKVVVLTGHEEFEYAKKGIKVGIADFLLKPINDDEIKKTALAIKERILRERTQIDEYDRVKEQLQQNMPVLREKLFNELILSSVDLNIIDEKIAYFDIKIKDDFYQVAVIEVFNSMEDNSFDEEKKLILKIRCLELAQQFFCKDQYIHVFSENSERIVILCNESSIDLWECCETLKSMLINRLKCFVCIGIGNGYDSLDRIRMSYKEACDSLRYRFIVGKNQVISFSNIYFAQEERMDIDSDVMSNFCFYLKSGIRDKYEELIRTVFNEQKLGIDAKEQVRVIACNFIANTLNVLTEAGIKYEEVFVKSVQPFEVIFKLDTLHELRDYLINISSEATQALNSMHGKKTRRVIKDIKVYLDNNYSNTELTLSEVAKKFFTNSSFLSRIFKEETGLNFGEYLFNIRMEKAVKLINSSDKMAYQIAEEVGIDDSHYFSVCFKKYTGVSFNSYKKSKLS